MKKKYMRDPKASKVLRLAASIFYRSYWTPSRHALYCFSLHKNRIIRVFIKDSNSRVFEIFERRFLFNSNVPVKLASNPADSFNKFLLNSKPRWETICRRWCPLITFRYLLTCLESLTAARIYLLATALSRLAKVSLISKSLNNYPLIVFELLSRVLWLEQAQSWLILYLFSLTF